MMLKIQISATLKNRLKAFPSSKPHEAFIKMSNVMAKICIELIISSYQKATKAFTKEYHVFVKWQEIENNEALNEGFIMKGQVKEYKSVRRGNAMRCKAYKEMRSTTLFRY